MGCLWPRCIGSLTTGSPRGLSLWSADCGEGSNVQSGHPKRQSLRGVLTWDIGYSSGGLFLLKNSRWNLVGRLPSGVIGAVLALVSLLGVVLWTAVCRG